MRVHIGEKIKYFRTKSKITQSKLAEGIISESYLSKIETGKIAPPREIVLLLCQKLKINPDATEIDHLQTLCHTWFEHLFYGMKEKATDSYNKIIQNIDNIANTSLITLVELHKLRYFILIQNRKEANKQYEYLQQLNLEGKEIYYWFKFSGYYYFDQLFYNKSLNLFQEATIYIRDVTKRETYDLFYMIALNASKLRKSYLSLENATNALTYYQNNYNLKRCAECHILLGIAYQRINELNKSIDSYQLAAKIANDIDDDNIMAISKQNIGKVYSIRGATEDAIYYYLDSFKARRNFPITKKIIPVSSLMKEYYNVGDTFKAERWLKKGIELCKNLDPQDSIYVYEFEVYKYLIIGEGSSFEELINKKVLPFLSERNLFYETFQYLKILANYYYKQRKYKLAANYYELANSTLNKIHTE